MVATAGVPRPHRAELPPPPWNAITIGSAAVPSQPVGTWSSNARSTHPGIAHAWWLPAAIVDDAQSSA
ncbi:MAG: hypothetical protein NT062_27550 [Proteobacteria bacterium]|nr:hypothetical protein [Pseudomonadota bacterium]